MATLGLALNVSAQSLECDNEVTLEQGRIEVAPTGSDDTDNIQCALDEAKRLGIPVVKLLSDDYSISRIQIEQFSGSFEGVGNQSTTLAILDGSIDCAQMISNRQAPAALKFIRGNVRVARMTIGSNLPCAGGPVELFVQIHFTGSPAGAVCGSETGFGFVDRTILYSFSGAEGSLVAGVGSISEGQLFSDCNDTLLGTLKVNRSGLAGHYYGVAPLLRGSGQVDINFTEFFNNRASVYSFDANHLMTVQANDFVKVEGYDLDHVSIFVRNDSDGPNENRAVVFRNRFDLTESSSSWDLTAVEIDSNPGVATSAAITNNNFMVDSPVADVIIIDEANGTQIANNSFNGEGNSMILVDDESFGTTITSNNMLPVFSDEADIVLSDGSTGIIVIGNQSASVQDDGIGNTVLNNNQLLQPSAAQASHTMQASHRAAILARFDAAAARLAGYYPNAAGLSTDKLSHKQPLHSGFPVFDSSARQ